MSLINQMLRDLQEQQKRPETSAPPETPRRSFAERLPRLPLPLAAGAGVGLLLLVCWWLAGALSGWMFEFEPGPVAVEQQEESTPEAGALSAEEYEALARELAEPQADEAVVLVEEEEAPPVIEEKLAVQEVVAAASSVVEPPPPTPEPVRKPVPVKKVATVKKPVAPPKVSSTRSRQTVRTVPGSGKKILFESTNPPFVRKPVAAQKRKSYATAKPLPQKLHPDQLPGAVVPGARKAPITTPFGAAEKAFQQGQLAQREQRSLEAVQSLRHALQLYPGHLAARELLADILNDEGQAGQAMALLTQGLEIAPDYMPFKKRQARLMIGQGDFKSAVQVLLNAGMPTVEEDPDAHALLASTYQRLAEPFLAAQTYRNLLVAWPQTGAFWIGLGRALEAEGLPEEASKAYRQALATGQLREDLAIYAVTRLEKI
jgi:MSHA biogenesis protein MshN